MGQVPAYVEYDSLGKSTVITQSLAIMEYLQEKYPEQGINVLTKDIDQRAKVIHPRIRNNITDRVSEILLNRNEVFRKYNVYFRFVKLVR